MIMKKGRSRKKQKTNIQSKNQEIHRSAKTLPRRKFLDIIQSKDLRHLYISDEWPEVIDSDDLRDTYDAIVKEDQKLVGVNYYDSYFNQYDFKFFEAAKIDAVEKGLIFFTWEPFYEKAQAKDTRQNLLELFKYYKLNINTKEEAELWLTRKERDLRIKSIRDKERNKEEVRTWEEEIVLIHEYVGIEMKYDTPLSLYRAYEKRAKKIIKNSDG